jgi:hypothetical protein
MKTTTTHDSLRDLLTKELSRFKADIKPELVDLLDDDTAGRCLRSLELMHCYPLQVVAFVTAELREARAKSEVSECPHCGGSNTDLNAVFSRGWCYDCDRDFDRDWRDCQELPGQGDAWEGGFAANH